MRAVMLSLCVVCAALFFGFAAFAADNAGGASSGGIAIPNPLADAKAGEWVLMEDVSGEESGEAIKVTLVAVDDASVTMRIEDIDADGVVAATREHVIPRAFFDKGREDMRKNLIEVTDDFVVIKGKEYPVVAVRYTAHIPARGGDPVEFKMWISDEIPVTGIAKSWSSDVKFSAGEVVDFGF